MKRTFNNFRNFAKTGLIIGIALIQFSNVQAQTSKKVLQDNLLNKTWVLKFLNEKPYRYTIKFTLEEQIIVFTSDGKSHEGKEKYYLSDKPDSIFQTDKVGKSKTGKYLIFQTQVRNMEDGGWNEKVSICEILELTDKRLVMKAANNTFLEYIVE